MHIPFDPAISLLEIYPTDIFNMTNIKGLFTAALFVITKEWKQPKSPSTRVWLNELWYKLTI